MSDIADSISAGADLLEDIAGAREDLTVKSEYSNVECVKLKKQLVTARRYSVESGGEDVDIVVE
jgi:hypothetical protein